tara:strand:+ start:1011 stop:1289 length:279 start_codon:yes stop_codon:yes gene_type:complete
MTINPHDLSELLYNLGYYVDDDTGEVMVEIRPDGTTTYDKYLVAMVTTGRLITKRDENWQLKIYLPNWKCFDSMEEYCKVFPNEQQCKDYDV